MFSLERIFLSNFRVVNIYEGKLVLLVNKVNWVVMNKFYPLTEKENVINLNEENNNYYDFLTNHPMFKLDNLEKKMLCKILGASSLQEIEENNYYKKRKKLLDEGLDCEILSLGAKKWRKGKLRIKVVVEFCPDEPEKVEPESPLDDIRKTINE